jgi:poly(3-hydroxybutyrate) depolymerase
VVTGETVRLKILGTLSLAAALVILPALRAGAQPATDEEVRNPLLVLQHLPHAPSHDRIQVRQYDFKELGAPSQYQLFVPSKYDASKPSALIVLLHCLQCPPDQFIRSSDLTELADERGYIVVAPMGVNLHGWYGARGNSIAVTTPRAGRAGQAPAPPDPANLGELSELDVMNVFEIIKKDFNIDPKRTYLAGQSMGGGGTFYIGIKHPDIWAALAAADPAVTGGPEQLQAIPKMPVIVIQGDADRLVSVDATRKWVAEMKTLGMTFEYIEVPGGDHMVPFIRTSENMKKVFDWFDAHPKK